VPVIFDNVDFASSFRRVSRLRAVEEFVHRKIFGAVCRSKRGTDATRKVSARTPAAARSAVRNRAQR
jgi:hypothetical protein